MQKMYIINPRPAFPSYFGFDFFKAYGMQPKAYAIDLSTTTIAAMAKPFFNITICEELISEADLNTDAEIIALTGKISQWPRMKELAQAFHNPVFRCHQS